MKSFASIFVGAALASLVAATPVPKPNSPAEENVAYPPPSSDEARDGQQVWVLIRTRAINEDETIPLSEWVAASEDYSGFTTDSLIDHPINDIVIVDVQPVEGTGWVDARRYGCFVSGGDLGSDVNFSTVSQNLDFDDGSEQFTVGSYTCGLA